MRELKETRRQRHHDKKARQTVPNEVPHEPVHADDNESAVERLLAVDEDDWEILVDPQEEPKHVQHIVEHSVSGEFFSVKPAKKREWKSLLQLLMSPTESGRDSGVERESGISRIARDFDIAGVLTVQGILTGIVWIEAIEANASDASSFVCRFGGHSDRSRQLRFILLKYLFHVDTCVMPYSKISWYLDCC